jgi:hypothetical protein
MAFPDSEIKHDSAIHQALYSATTIIEIESAQATIDAQIQSQACIFP